MTDQGIPFYTLVRKEIVRFARIWPQTLLPSSVTTALYFIIFGSFIGSQLSDIKGYSYMEFLVPGLIMMAVITNSYTNVVSSFFLSKFQRSIEELLVSPIHNAVVIMGFVFGGVVRGVIISLIVTIISILFVPLQIANFWLVLLFVVLTSTFFSLAGLMNGIFAKKFDDISIVPTFVLAPLTYLGGVFYSIDLLSPLWRGLSMLNPILYMVNGLRYGFLGITDVSVVAGTVMLVFFTAALFYANLILMKKGIGLKS